MKLFIILRLNEYASDGYDFDVMVENRWKMYKDDEDIHLITTINIDMNDYSSFLAIQSEVLAAKLIEKAKVNMAVQLDNIKDFQSKFLLIGSNE
jgi:hypothetical protein